MKNDTNPFFLANGSRRTAAGDQDLKSMEISRRSVYRKNGIQVDLVYLSTNEYVVQEERNKVIKSRYFDNQEDAMQYLRSRGLVNR